MAKKFIGIDIQKNAVAAVVINSGFRGNWIQGHTYIPFSGQPEENSGLTAALGTLVDQIDVAGCSCVVSVPAEQVSFRNIQVPFKQVKKIRQILPFELEPSLPFPVERLIIDFHAIKTEGQGQDEHTDLIAAAADSARLESYLELLSSFGIDPEIVTVGGYPAAVCLSQLGDIPDNTLLLDIGEDKSTLFVFDAGQLSLVRSIPAGSEVLARKETLWQNIQRTLYAFEESRDDEFRPERLYLTGPAPGENGFETEMARLLEVPARRTDLVNDTSARINNRPTESWKPDVMDNAFALALMDIIGIKGLNFRKGPFAVKKRWAEHRKNFIRSGILAAAVLILMLINFSIDYYSKKGQLNDLNSRIKKIFLSTFPDVRKVVDPLQQMRVKIDEARKSSLFPTTSENNLLMIDILNELSKRIPAGIDARFTRMVIGEDSVVITGNTDTFNSVDTMKGRLEAAGIFEAVTIVSTSKDKSGNRIRFRLKVKI